MDTNMRGNSTADEQGLTRIVWTTVRRNFICVHLWLAPFFIRVHSRSLYYDQSH